jgi:hypothetical protein
MKTQNRFADSVLWKEHCWACPLATAISRPYPARLLSLRISQKRVYSNSPRKLEELKHNNEQTLANGDPKTLRKVARNTLKKVDGRPREGGGHFRQLLQSSSGSSS